MNKKTSVLFQISPNPPKLRKFDPSNGYECFERKAEKGSLDIRVI